MTTVDERTAVSVCLHHQAIDALRRLQPWTTDPLHRLAVRLALERSGRGKSISFFDLTPDIEDSVAFDSAKWSSLSGAATAAGLEIFPADTVVKRFIDHRKRGAIRELLEADRGVTERRNSTATASNRISESGTDRRHSTADMVCRWHDYRWNEFRNRTERNRKIIFRATGGARNRRRLPVSRSDNYEIKGPLYDNGAGQDCTS